jgi:hypothetical protein
MHYIKTPLSALDLYLEGVWFEANSEPHLVLPCECELLTNSCALSRDRNLALQAAAIPTHLYLLLS